MVVRFLDDESICMVPKKVVTFSGDELPSVGMNCFVKWTDRKKYETKILAIGNK